MFCIGGRGGARSGLPSCTGSSLYELENEIRACQAGRGGEKQDVKAFREPRGIQGGRADGRLPRCSVCGSQAAGRGTTGWRGRRGQILKDLWLLCVVGEPRTRGHGMMRFIPRAAGTRGRLEALKLEDHSWDRPALESPCVQPPVSLLLV